jgi:hypothetical protein
MVTIRRHRSHRTKRLAAIARVMINLSFLIALAGIATDRQSIVDNVRSMPDLLHQILNR